MKKTVSNMIRTPSDRVPIKIMNAAYIERNIFMYIDEFILSGLFYQINLNLLHILLFLKFDSNITF